MSGGRDGVASKSGVNVESVSVLSAQDRYKVIRSVTDDVILFSRHFFPAQLFTSTALETHLF